MRSPVESLSFKCSTTRFVNASTKRFAHRILKHLPPGRNPIPRPSHINILALITDNVYSLFSCTQPHFAPGIGLDCGVRIALGEPCSRRLASPPSENTRCSNRRQKMTLTEPFRRSRMKHGTSYSWRVTKLLPMLRRRVRCKVTD